MSLLVMNKAVKGLFAGMAMLAIAGLATLASPANALADFAIEIIGPGFYAGGVVICDNCPGDLNLAIGSITVVTSSASLITPPIPGFADGGLIQSAITNSPGGPLQALLDMHVLLSSLLNTGGTVTVLASATGYTFPPAGGTATLVSSVGGTNTGASDTFQQWADLVNALFGMGPITPGVQGPFSGAAFANVASTSFLTVTPFSLTERGIMTLGANSLTSYDFQSQVVAAPAALVLLGLGLSGVGVISWRRRRRS